MTWLGMTLMTLAAMGIFAAAVVGAVAALWRWQERRDGLR